MGKVTCKLSSSNARVGCNHMLLPSSVGLVDDDDDELTDDGSSIAGGSVSDDDGGDDDVKIGEPIASDSKSSELDDKDVISDKDNADKDEGKEDDDDCFVAESTTSSPSATLVILSWLSPGDVVDDDNADESNADVPCLITDKLCFETTPLICDDTSV